MCKRIVGTTLLFLLGSTALADTPRDSVQRQGDAFRELDGQFSLHLIDAITGQPIPNAIVEFEGERAKTNQKGRVSFDAPIDLEDGDDKRFATFTSKGYSTSKLQLDFMTGSLWFNRYSISPKLTSAKLRIVVDWAEEPSDLDAHLVKENTYHISYREKRKYQDQAWLDRDDTNGFGPETITINNLDENATYRFFIHDYTNRATQSSSGISEGKAHVRIYDDSGLIYTFKAPKDAAGTIWNVFKVENGQVKPVNKMK